MLLRKQRCLGKLSGGVDHKSSPEIRPRARLSRYLAHCEVPSFEPESVYWKVSVAMETCIQVRY